MISINGLRLFDRVFEWFQPSKSIERTPFGQVESPAVPAVSTASRREPRIPLPLVLLPGSEHQAATSLIICVLWLEPEDWWTVEAQDGSSNCRPFGSFTVTVNGVDLCEGRSISLGFTHLMRGVLNWQALWQRYPIVSRDINSALVGRGKIATHISRPLQIW